MTIDLIQQQTSFAYAFSLFSSKIVKLINVTTACIQWFSHFSSHSIQRDEHFVITFTKTYLELITHLMDSMASGSQAKDRFLYGWETQLRSFYRSIASIFLQPFEQFSLMSNCPRSGKFLWTFISFLYSKYENIVSLLSLHNPISFSISFIFPFSLHWITNLTQSTWIMIWNFDTPLSHQYFSAYDLVQEFWENRTPHAVISIR